MSRARKLKWENQKTLASGSITANYAAIGTATENPARIVEIHNFTDAKLQFSTDGTNDKFPMMSNTSKIIDLCANKTVDAGAYLERGELFYVKRIETPTTGSVYVTLLYGEE